MNKKTVIIVDCQKDFISGSMAVPGADEAVCAIVAYLILNQDEIEEAVLTKDWHPVNHCSFKEYGGKWPTHCVQNTPGAEIDSRIMNVLKDLNIRYFIFNKGCLSDVEEYGAFPPGDGNVFPRNEIIVCGIAGDYCVKETVGNLIKKGHNPKILLKGIASIDDGTIIQNFIKEHNLETV